MKYFYALLMMTGIFSNSVSSAGFIKSQEELYEASCRLREKKDDRILYGLMLSGSAFSLYMIPQYVPDASSILSGTIGGGAGVIINYVNSRIVDYCFDMGYTYPDPDTFPRNFPDHSYACARHPGKEVNIQSLMSFFAQKSYNDKAMFIDANCEAPSNPYVKNAKWNCMGPISTLSKYIVLHQSGAIAFERPGNGFHQYDARCMKPDGSETSGVYGNPDGPKFYLTSAEPKIVSEFRQHYDFSAEIKGGETDARELRLKYE